MGKKRTTKKRTSQKSVNKRRWPIIAGIVAAAVLFAVLLYTTLANHGPIIASLEAEPEIVLPSGSCQIACTASDSDGGELSYAWSATGGNITGTGPEVIWTAPQEVGTYYITVVVNHSNGGSATRSLPINVSSGPADRVYVVYFHRTQRCPTCIHAEELTRDTVETYFADELESDKLTFQVINIDDKQNADIVEHYGAYGSQLFINTIKDGTDHIEEATDLYVLIHNDEAFVTALKSKIEKSLNGET